MLTLSNSTAHAEGRYENLVDVRAYWGAKR